MKGEGIAGRPEPAARHNMSERSALSSMPITSRPYRDEGDYARMWALLNDLYRLAGPAVYCTVGDLDWWRATDDDPAAVARTRLWTDDTGAPSSASPGRAGSRSISSPTRATARSKGRCSPGPSGGGSTARRRRSPSSLRRERHRAPGRPVRPRVRARGLRPQLSRPVAGRAAAGTAPAARLHPAPRPRQAISSGAWRSIGTLAPSWMTTAKHRAVLRASTYRLDLDLAPVAPDRTFAAFCIVWFDEANRIGCSEPVGRHSAHRRRGLARALLDGGRAASSGWRARGLRQQPRRRGRRERALRVGRLPARRSQLRLAEDALPLAARPSAPTPRRRAPAGGRERERRPGRGAGRAADAAGRPAARAGDRPRRRLVARPGSLPVPARRRVGRGAWSPSAPGRSPAWPSPACASRSAGSAWSPSPWPTGGRGSARPSSRPPTPPCAPTSLCDAAILEARHDNAPALASTAGSASSSPARASSAACRAARGRSSFRPAPPEATRSCPSPGPTSSFSTRSTPSTTAAGATRICSTGFTEGPGPGAAAARRAAGRPGYLPGRAGGGPARPGRRADPRRLPRADRRRAGGGRAPGRRPRPRQPAAPRSGSRDPRRAGRAQPPARPRAPQPAAGEGLPPPCPPPPRLLRLGAPRESRAKRGTVAERGRSRWRDVGRISLPAARPSVPRSPFRVRAFRARGIWSREA